MLNVLGECRAAPSAQWRRDRVVDARRDAGAYRGAGSQNTVIYFFLFRVLLCL